MNQQTHMRLWDQMRLRHGIALRVIEQVPADKLGAPEYRPRQHA